jgi:4-diphosphocytidyl-2C-methyl-D-erythritol kinase
MSGAVFSAMSGTGSTVYGIFNDIENALKAVKELPNNYFVHLSN